MIENRSEEYIKFIESQMEYFEAKSGREQKKYRVLSFLTLLCNAVIPVVSVYSSMPVRYRVVITSLSAGSVIFNGVLMIYNSKENWKDNRNYYTELQRELRGYRLLSGEYEGMDEDTAFRTFFSRCEAILDDDKAKWNKSVEKEK